MSIQKIAVCDSCGKQTPFHGSHERWFIVNVSHVYCSKECFEKDLKSGNHSFNSEAGEIDG